MSSTAAQRTMRHVYPTTDLSISYDLLALFGAESWFLMVVDGEPLPKPRPRFGQGNTYSSADQRAAERTLGWEFKEFMDGQEPATGKLAVVWMFYRSTRRRVDLDNLVKLGQDAGNGVLWVDDSQIVSSAAMLGFDNATPRTVVAVGRMKGTQP